MYFATATNSIKKPVLVITGPTASGKSAFVYGKLTGLPLEIVITDSGQVYKELTVGVAAPDTFEQKVFPHHLLQQVSITEKYSAGQYCKEAQNAINEIHSRKKIPALVGGTFFYLKSLWDGLSHIPDISPEIISYVNNLDMQKVRENLMKCDRESYDRLLPHDTQRNRRALMVSLSTEKPFSSYTPEGGIWGNYNFLAICLYPPRDKMYADINKRTKKIFADGIIEETANLIKTGFSPDSPGFKTIGYKQVVQALVHEKPVGSLQAISMEKLCEQVALSTRHFAKRQMTWIHADNRLKRIDPVRDSSHVSDQIKRFCTQISGIGEPE